MQPSLTKFLEIEGLDQTEEPGAICRYYPSVFEGKCSCGYILEHYQHLHGNGFFREITHCSNCGKYTYTE
jgi:hypothetical protein